MHDEQIEDERPDCERPGCPGKMEKRSQRRKIAGGFGEGHPGVWSTETYFVCPVCKFDTRPFTV
jgi:hypothetical protein